jgi:hypothetical protein
MTESSLKIHKKALSLRARADFHVGELRKIGTPGAVQLFFASSPKAAPDELIVLYYNS